MEREPTWAELLSRLFSLPASDDPLPPDERREAESEAMEGWDPRDEGATAR